MAIVLSSPENINFLLFLVKLAIAIGTIAILLVLVFWLRLKNIEKRMYLHRKSLISLMLRLLSCLCFEVLVYKIQTTNDISVVMQDISSLQYLLIS